VGLIDIIGGAFSGLAGDPYGYQRTKQAQQSSQLYNLLSQLKIGETLRNLNKQIQWEKGLQEIPTTEEVPESDAVAEIAKQYGGTGLRTVPRSYRDVQKDIAQYALSQGELQPFLDIGKQEWEEKEHEHKKSLWPLEEQNLLANILYTTEAAKKLGIPGIKVTSQGVFVPGESPATPPATPPGVPITTPLTLPAAGPGEREAAIDKIRAEVQDEAAQAQAQAQGNQPLATPTSIKPQGTSPIEIRNVGTFYPFQKEPTYEMRTIYGPGGKTKVIPIEKGKIVEPPPGWSFRPPEKTDRTGEGETEKGRKETQKEYREMVKKYQNEVGGLQKWYSSQVMKEGADIGAIVEEYNRRLEDIVHRYKPFIQFLKSKTATQGTQGTQGRPGITKEQAIQELRNRGVIP
jgi:hypothetical protein